MKLTRYQEIKAMLDSPITTLVGVIILFCMFIAFIELTFFFLLFKLVYWLL